MNLILLSERIPGLINVVYTNLFFTALQLDQFDILGGATKKKMFNV